MLQAWRISENNNLAGKPKEERKFWKTRHRWKDNIKLAQDRTK
jgi:hypothetical protein